MQKVSYEYNKIFQKQPPDVFCKKRCSEKFRNFQRKIPVLKSLFNEVAGPQVFFFSQVDFFPVNNAKLLKTPILRNIGQRLLLFIFIFIFFYFFFFLVSLKGIPWTSPDAVLARIGISNAPLSKTTEGKISGASSHVYLITYQIKSKETIT